MTQRSLHKEDNGEEARWEKQESKNHKEGRKESTVI